MARASDQGTQGVAFTALRNKFADDLEEILQCPVCYESLSGTVPTCIQGHHVCTRCQLQLLNCPYCKCQFNGTRNYLAESLITKFDEIKTSLIDPKNHVNKKAMVCVQTQTDTGCESNVVALISNETNGPSVDFRIAPVVGKGKYPCRIGDCTEELPHGRMIPHLRYYHKTELIEEKISDSSNYEKSWEINYELPNEFKRAISIPNMGLFFLHVTIDSEGNLSGNVRIVNTRLVAQEFQYTLDVFNSHSSTSYKGMVIAGRTGKAKVDEKSLFVNNLFMAHLLKKNKTFSCKLILDRVCESEMPLKKKN